MIQGPASSENPCHFRTYRRPCTMRVSRTSRNLRFHPGAVAAMSQPRRFSPRIGWVFFAAFTLAASHSPALAQFTGGGSPNQALPGGQAPVAKSALGVASATVKLKAPSEFQVYQRDVNGKADIPIVLDDFDKNSTIVSAVVTQIPGNARITFKQAESKLVGVPVGGPYLSGQARRLTGDGDGRQYLRGRPLGAGRAIEHGRGG